MSHPASKAATSAAVALLLLLISVAGASAQLAEVWRPLLNKTGVLEKLDCLYQFTPSSPSQVGNATVVQVAQDYVVIVEKRDQRVWEHTIPLARITIRRAR